MWKQTLLNNRWEFEHLKQYHEVIVQTPTYPTVPSHRAERAGSCLISNRASPVMRSSRGLNLTLKRIGGKKSEWVKANPLWCHTLKCCVKQEMGGVGKGRTMCVEGSDRLCCVLC
eukprot:Hpha_TRINITY_DN15268_c1_g3::TRINITY_DN15268_c1_g3_i1::g.64475::m.64475